MNVEWNHQQIKKLIDLYKHKTELWDPKDDNYHAKSIKNNAWGEIAVDIGRDVSLVKAKIGSLLSSFRREKSKTKKSMGAGKGPHKIYISNWFAFKYFDFLKEKDASKGFINIENICDEEYLEDDSRSAQSFVNENNELQNAEQLNLEWSGPLTSRNKEDNSAIQEDLVFPDSPNKKPKLQEDPRLSRAHNVLKSVLYAPRDECSTFGEHLVSKLRKFNEHQRAILMHKINNLVFEAEMEFYSEHISPMQKGS